MTVSQSVSQSPVRRSSPLTFPPRAQGGTYSAFLHQVGDHDYDPSVLLPHHPPEVLERGLEGTLGGDVRSGLVVALKRERGAYIC